MKNKRLLLPSLIAVLFLYAPINLVGAATQAQSDMVTTSPDATFEKIIGKLVENNYIILAANQQLGLITFRNLSEDNSSSIRRHVNILEGTILLRQETPTLTRIHAKLTLSWQEIDRRGSNLAFGVQHDADAGWYKGVFDALGFLPSSSNH